MKLRKSQVHRLAGRIVANLSKAGAILHKGHDEKIVVHVDAAITEDLMVEDRLNDEIRLLMEQYAGEIAKGNVDYHKMFQMIKRKMIRERNLVL